MNRTTRRYPQSIGSVLQAVILALIAYQALGLQDEKCFSDEFDKFDAPSITGGHFGWSLDVHNGKALVGAPFVDGGYAYIYDIDSGDELLRLRGLDVSANDLFGQNVKLTENYALVSASQGRAAYLFDAQTGQQIRRFSHPNASAGFGWYVDMNDDLVIVGDHGNSTKGGDAGSVFIFDIDNGQVVDQLLPEGASAILDQFGLGLDLDKDRLVIGAPGASGNGFSDGAAYVYDVNTGTRLHTLTADDTVGFADFGRGISVDGDRALIGAPHYGNGAAYLFDINTGEQLRKFSAPPSLAGTFGFRVALHGNLALIGDPYRYVEGRGYYVGGAFLYDTSTGELVHSFLPDDAVPQDIFGWDLDFEGSRFVFGAAEAAGGAGEVYSAVVPEPASMLLAIGAAAIGWLMGVIASGGHPNPTRSVNRRAQVSPRQSPRPAWATTHSLRHPFACRVAGWPRLAGHRNELGMV